MQISIASLFRLFYFADFSLEPFEIRQVDISIIYNEIMDKTAVTIGKKYVFRHIAELTKYIESDFHFPW